MKKKYYNSIFSVFISLFFVSVFTIVFPKKVSAAQLSEAFLRLDRMTASQTTSGSVCLKMATTTGTDAKVNVTFPTGFTVNATATN